MGLQSLIHKAEVEGLIQGVAICRNGPRISHLFFANDSVLFCRAKEDECQKILDILAVYERESVQKINHDKTNIFFSSNTLHETQVWIQQLLGVPTIRQYEKLFGSSHSCRPSKEAKLHLFEGKGVEKTPRVEGKAFIPSWEGSLN